MGRHTHDRLSGLSLPRTCIHSSAPTLLCLHHPFQQPVYQTAVTPTSSTIHFCHPICNAQPDARRRCRDASQSAHCTRRTLSNHQKEKNYIPHLAQCQCQAANVGTSGISGTSGTDTYTCTRKRSTPSAKSIRRAYNTGIAPRTATQQCTATQHGRCHRLCLPLLQRHSWVHQRRLVNQNVRVRINSIALKTPLVSK